MCVSVCSAVRTLKSRSTPRVVRTEVQRLSRIDHAVSGTYTCAYVPVQQLYYVVVRVRACCYSCGRRAEEEEGEGEEQEEQEEEEEQQQQQQQQQ